MAVSTDPMGPLRLRRTEFVESHGRGALFGTIYVSARNGNAVRAFLTRGSWSTEQRYEKVANVRRVLVSWAAVVKSAA